MAKDVLNFLPYLGWRVGHVSRVYLQAHLFKIGLDDSPLCPLYKSVPMTWGINPTDPLYFMFSRKATVEFSLTARRLMSERTLAGVTPRVTTPNEDRYLAVTAKNGRRSTASDLSRQSSLATGTTVSKADVQTLRAHWSICS
ncbi:hypothetical protein TNCV_2335071 [Trichonephila clavipes]|uniref:Uncharacterized protein n=1 Tax=Trichonephila clavipes TaxID=2585209 RepID=A0A8X6SKT0_TRICX|nr:hypothetical protein TNCV_2335071 [Trichonephila clavipes]